MTIAITSAFITILSVTIITLDLKRHPQSMKIMNIVWVLTALWASILGVIAYYYFGREEKMNMDGMDMSSMKMSDKKPKWQSITLSTLHCGAGCTLADIIGSIFLYFIPITILKSTIIGGWVSTYILALIFGIYFQYVAIKQTKDLPPIKIITMALKADFLSLTAWQIGMYGWMYLLTFHFKVLDQQLSLTWDFWFAMQQAMVAGFILALPINYMLIKRGIKSGM